MTIIGQVKRIGALRQFETTDNFGHAVTKKVIEMEIQCGNNTFIGDLYGEGAEKIHNIAAGVINTWAQAAVGFSVREYKTAENVTRRVQSITFYCVEFMNPTCF